MKMAGLMLGLCILEAGVVQAGEGYDAGYNWAESNGIDDPDNCYNASGGYISKSPSFTEGCLAYLHDDGVTDDNDEMKGDESSDDNDRDDE